MKAGNLRDIGTEARKIRAIYNEAWEKNWGFVPFSEKEFDLMTKEMKPLLVPNLLWLAEIEGEPVGFILCVPDIHVEEALWTVADLLGEEG